MNVNLITSEEIDSIIKKLEAIDKKVESLTNGISSRSLYTIIEACELLKVSKRTLQRYRDQQMLPFTQVGSKIFFQASDIQSFLEKNKVKANRNY